MNLAALEQKLIAAARANPPAETVPYAFEQRILARLRERSAYDPTAFWARSLWRAAVSCLAVVLMLGAFTWLVPAGDGTETLSQEFEATVLAPVHADSQF
jgi:anti-sigma-K factor RskA